MNLFFNTKCLLEITTADIIFFLAKLTEGGVTSQNVAFIDPLTVRLEVNKADLRTVKKLSDRIGAQIKIIGMQGIYTVIQALNRRFILVCGVILIIFMTLYVPTRIFFVSIEGNERINEMYILEKAEAVGIFFGASRKDVRSEQMKNSLLQAIPELKWAGINTFGCRAEIHVVERDMKEQLQPDSSVVQGIYAVRDGIVSSVTVTKGSALCKPGQAIRKGQLLVSGYTDCGLVMRAEHAEGEVRGVTQRRIEAVTPNSELKRGEVNDNSSRWSLQIGKKQIKLHIDSGNSGSECGKIYKTYTLTLPGGFQLPLSMVKETVTTYESVSQPVNLDATQMTQLANRYISDCMIAGNVIHADSSVVPGNGVMLLTGVYTCEELIGKLKNEEIG